MLVTFSRESETADVSNQIKDQFLRAKLRDSALAKYTCSYLVGPQAMPLIVGLFICCTA